MRTISQISPICFLKVKHTRFCPGEGKDAFVLLDLELLLEMSGGLVQLAKTS